MGFNTGELARELPGLICVTDIEKQLEGIRTWLNRIAPVSSIGICLNGTGSEKEIFSINLQEDVVKEIDNRFTECGTGISGPATECFWLSMSDDGTLAAIDAMDREPFTEMNGFAFSLTHQGTSFGKFLLAANGGGLNGFIFEASQFEWFRSVLSSLLFNAWSHREYQEKIRILNLYETVSSSLCYAGDLFELLTTIISIVVSEVPSEEGSILLLNHETNELEFFSAIGETGAGLVQFSFPADKGVAGKALQDGLPVIVADVETCPYFFGQVDNDSGFVTRSILAVPVIIGEEKVGVIEAINKVGKESFDETDKRILVAIADEVGLAVKNARMFDYVVNSYCKLRQGEMSCKGCVRPLKSWTPCARQLGLV